MTRGPKSALLSKLAILTCFVVGSIAIMSGSPAHEVLAPSSTNLRWHAPSKSITVTFLGKDQKENAVLVLKKAAVLDTEIIIQTDASTITLASGDSIRIALSIPAKTEGSISRLKLEGGDLPSLSLNGTEQVPLKGKWIQAVTSKDQTLSLELKDATFATVKFDPSAIAKGEATVSPAAEAAVAAVPAKASDPPRESDAPELLHEAAPAQLKHAVMAFAEGVDHKCPKCNGTGRVAAPPPPASSNTRGRGLFIPPSRGPTYVRCNICGGSGHARDNDETLKRLASTFVRTMAAVKRDDSQTQEALSASYKMVNDAIIGNQPTWVLLTDNGKSVLSQHAPVTATPVIVRVNIRRLSVVDGKKEYLVEVDGTDQQVRVTDPAIGDEVDSGAALIGGLLMPASSGNTKMAVSRGFVIAPPVDRALWWWFGPKPGLLPRIR